MTSSPSSVAVSIFEFLEQGLTAHLCQVSCIGQIRHIPCTFFVLNEILSEYIQQFRHFFLLALMELLEVGRLDFLISLGAIAQNVIQPDNSILFSDG